MTKPLLRSALFVALLLSACESDQIGREGQAEPMIPIECGPECSSRLDAGSLPDAGTPDLGTPDAGTPDLGTPDAGTPDLGTPDAAEVDAGIEPDAGTPDAATPDAGSNPKRPVGMLGLRLPIAGAPYGIAVSSQNVIYVTLATANMLGRGVHPATSLSPAVMVGATPTDVAFSNVGDPAWVTNQYGPSLGLVDPATNLSPSALSVPAGPFRVKMGPTGLYVTSNDTTFRVLDASGSVVLTSLPVGSGANGLAFTPDGSRIYVSSTNDGTITEIDGLQKIVLRTFSIGGRLQDVALSPDASLLYVANETTPEIEIVDIRSGSVARTIPLGGGAFGLVPTPDGSQLYFTLTSSGEIGIIDRVSETIIDRLQAGGSPRRIAFDPSGTTAYVSNEQGWVDVVQ